MPTWIEGDTLRFVQHPGQGFFSCCTIHLQGILRFFNEQHTLPRIIQSTEQFMFYKTPETWQRDIKQDYFEPSTSPDIQYQGQPVAVTDLDVEEQYSDYRHLNYAALTPFLKRYFYPSPNIQKRLMDMVQKYRIQPDITCVLFYRGNDKAKETPLPTYQEYVLRAQHLLETQPYLQFLIQSDETEFLDAMKQAFPQNHVILYDEIRHMSRNPQTTVDKVFRHQNAEMSKNYLAITFLMSQCKYVLCGSGNCSLWIALFRGHAHGLIQFSAQQPAQST